MVRYERSDRLAISVRSFEIVNKLTADVSAEIGYVEMKIRPKPFGYERERSSSSDQSLRGI